GWKDFAKAHNFKQNDMLLFKYVHGSCFKVWVFNEQDSCEKAGSYFVRKSALDAGISSLQLKREKARKNSEHEGSDTEETSARASRRKARREKTDESFVVVMKANNDLSYTKNQYMELRTNGTKWHVRFNVEQRCGGGVLVSGWCNFVVDNSLQESDVCLFKLVSQKGELVVFDVLIFALINLLINHLLFDALD
ncbi:B3 domain-containing protein REM16, partial [Bienertia sinuspersici]